MSSLPLQIQDMVASGVVRYLSSRVRFVQDEMTYSPVICQDLNSRVKVTAGETSLVLSTRTRKVRAHKYTGNGCWVKGQDRNFVIALMVIRDPMVIASFAES